MNEQTKALLDRTFWFGVNILKFLASLKFHHIYSNSMQQLSKSSTSVGANYEEAQAAESKRDFIHKIGIALKEARESHYWLRVLKALYSEKEKQKIMNEYLQEAEEIRKIFASIKLSAENGK